MILFYRQVVSRLNLTDLEAFETAYVFAFGKQGHVTPDLCEFKLHGILPKYVIKWVKSLERKPT